MNKPRFHSAWFTLAITCTGWNSAVYAADLLNDNFDSYANQAAFEAVWTPLSGVGGSLSGTQSVSPPNSVRFIGDGSTVYRNMRSFAEAGAVSATNIVRFSFDFYDDASAAPFAEYTQLVDGAPVSGGQLIAIGLNSNQSSTDSGGNFYMARIQLFSPPAADPDGGPTETGTLGANAFFKLNDFGVGLRSTGWHNLSVEVSNTEYKFFVDGQYAERVANTTTARSYDSVRLGPGVASAHDAYFDNVLVQTVPEPTSALLALMGAAGLLVQRRRW